MTAHRCAAAALVHDGRVLLAHRSPGRRWYPDVWDLPGGHLDPDESAGEALVRELAEEIGIRVPLPVHSPNTVLVGDDVELAIWVIYEWAGTPRNHAPDEHDELRWFAPDELEGLPLAHPDYPALIERWAHPR